MTSPRKVAKLVVAVTFVVVGSRLATGAEPSDDRVQFPRNFVATYSYLGETFSVYPRNPGARRFKESGGFLREFPVVMEQPKLTEKDGESWLEVSARAAPLPEATKSALRREIASYYTSRGLDGGAGIDVSNIEVYEDECEGLELTALIPTCAPITLQKLEFSAATRESVFRGLAVLPPPHVAALKRFGEDQLQVRLILQQRFHGLQVLEMSASEHTAIKQDASERCGPLYGVYDTDALQTLKTEFSRTFELTVTQSRNEDLNKNAVAMADKCLQRLTEMIATLPALSLDTLNQQEKIFIFNTELGRQEVSPEQYSYLTTNLTTHEKASAEMRSFLDDVRDKAKSEKDHRKWREYVKRHKVTKTAGSSGFKYGVGEGWGGGDLHMEKDNIDENSGEENEVKTSHSYFRTLSDDQKSTHVDDFMNWVGRNLTQGYKRKDYSLRRVSKEQIEQAVAAVVRIEVPGASYLRPVSRRVISIADQTNELRKLFEASERMQKIDAVMRFCGDWKQQGRPQTGVGRVRLIISIGMNGRIYVAFASDAPDQGDWIDVDVLHEARVEDDRLVVDIQEGEEQVRVLEIEVSADHKMLTASGFKGPSEPRETVRLVRVEE